MRDCNEDKKEGVKAVRLSAKILKMLRYLKEPVEHLSELYNRYPDGGEWGWFAVVTSLDTIAVWSVELKKWVPIISGGGKSVQSDWEETDEQSLAFILNKPEIKQSDWNETDEQSLSFIQNKPDITVNGDYEKYFQIDKTENPLKFEIHDDKSLLLTYETLLGLADYRLEENQSYLKERYGVLHILITNRAETDNYISFTRKEGYSLLGFETEIALEAGESILLTIRGKGKNRIVSSTKLNLERYLKPNLSYTDIFPSIYQTGGKYSIDSNRDLMYSMAISTPTFELEETGTKNELVYGTNYFLFTNFNQEKPIEIHIKGGENQLNYLLGFESPIKLAKGKCVEVAIKGYGNERYISCLHLDNGLPDIDALSKPNENYTKYFSKDQLSNGIYHLHESKDLMCDLVLDSNVEFTEGDSSNPNVFGTTYLIIANQESANPVSIIFPPDNTGKTLLLGMDEVVTLNKGEYAEIAIKGYGEKRFITCLHNNSSSNSRVNIPYLPLYPDILPEGNYRVHDDKELMYYNQLEQSELELKETATNTRNVYGTTYILLHNGPDNRAEITFKEDETGRTHLLGVPQPLIVDKGEAVEIAIKGYGDRRYITCSHGVNSLDLRQGKDAELIDNLERVHVNPNYKGVKQDGSISYPFKTFTKAMTDTQKEYPVFVLEKGDYSGEPIVNVDRDCMITSIFNSIYPGVWLPKLNITAGDVTLNNVLTWNISVNQPADATLIIENSTVYQPVTVTSKGELYFKNCFFYFATGMIIDTSNITQSHLYLLDCFQASVYINSGYLYAYNTSFVKLQNTGIGEIDHSQDAVYITANAKSANFYNCSFTYNSTWASDFSYRIVSRTGLIYLSGCELGKAEHIGVNFIQEDIGEKNYGSSTNPKKLRTVIEGLTTKLEQIEQSVIPFESIEINPKRESEEFPFSCRIDTGNKVNYYCLVTPPGEVTGINILEIDIDLKANTWALIQIEQIDRYSIVELKCNGKRFLVPSEHNAESVIEVRNVNGVYLFSKLTNPL